MYLNHWKNALAVLIVIVWGTACGTLSPAPTLTSRVSVASNGRQGNGGSDHVSVSSNGWYMVFVSYASNLVPGDTNNEPDVFMRDTRTGTTRRISVASDGTQGNGYSYFASISANGRYVAFESESSNLVRGDTNDAYDIFLHDVRTGTTRRISTTSDGTQGNGESRNPSISANGRYVAFESEASNLVKDDMNGTRDIFVRDLQTGTTALVSLAPNGTQGNGMSIAPSFSADGRYVAFASLASNLENDDTNDTWDIFVHDLQTGTTRRVSVASDGTQGNGGSDWHSISADGRYVAFVSEAINLVRGDTNSARDVFVHDLQTGTTRRISVAPDGTQGNGDSTWPSISADGRYVAFESGASNLVDGDTNDVDDIFVRDLQTGTTRRVSAASNGRQGNHVSRNPSISADGSYVAFHSWASNLVPGDTNGTYDVFMRVLETSTLEP